MTARSRGRLVTFTSIILLCAALIVMTLRLRSSEDALEATREAVAAQKVAIQVNHATVSELCRTNGILRGVLIEWVELLRITEGRVDDGIAPHLKGRYRLGRQVLEGFLEQLDQQTACREVIRP